MISTSKNVNIILIDDDADDQEIFSEAIKEGVPDVKFCAINHEKELYAYFDTNEIPYLFFLDWSIPCNFEKKCLEQIKMQKHLNRVPVIIYTSLTAESVVKDLYERGASLFVNKPNSFSELVQVLTAILKIDWTNFKLEDAANNFLKDFDAIKIP